MIYTVTFNPALDYVVRVTDFCLGATNRCEREELYCGGKGINVSLVLHELGIQNTALGFIAGFTGTALKQKLNAHGITTDFILLPKGFSRINIKLKSGEETEINGRGPQIDPQSLEALYRKLDALRPGDTLVLAGSIPATLPADIYEQILRRLSGRELRFVVDAAGSLLERVLPYRPFLIKPNHHELGELARNCAFPRRRGADCTMCAQAPADGGAQRPCFDGGLRCAACHRNRRSAASEGRAGRPQKLGGRRRLDGCRLFGRILGERRLPVRPASGNCGGRGNCLFGWARSPLLHRSGAENALAPFCPEFS